MFQKGSFIAPSDSSGVFLVKVMQTYRVNQRKHARIGNFLKVILKNTRVRLIKKRKKKMKAIAIRTKVVTVKTSGVYYKFFDNGLVLLKKRLNTLGKEIKGPTSTALKIKKFRIAFNAIF